MNVLTLLTCLCLVTVGLTHDLTQVEDFMEHNTVLQYNLKKRFRPIYHVSSTVGWLNNPSGFTHYKGRYHLFYQYHPYTGAWGALHWGHVVSENLIDWFHYPPAVFPKEYYDRHGCLAGSAVVHNSYLTLFYTGLVLTQNTTRQSQNVAISADAITYQKYEYNPVIDKPPLGIAEFRNPKVWRFRNMWYMIVGSSTDEERGQLILYTSLDLFNWKINGTLARSHGDMGYLWENPEFFELDGQYVLIFSVQGIQPEATRFRNLYQSGYIVGSFNYIWAQFEDVEISTATFNELDYGHDFYGVQSMQDVDGRRLLIGWLGMWESEYRELRDGWAGMLTIVRELRLTPRGRILMRPLKEMEEVRAEVLERAWYSPGESFQAGTRHFELIVNGSSVLSDAALSLEWGGDSRFTISYLSDRGEMRIDRGGTDGVRRADWMPARQIYWRIFVDGSSIEVFCGDGEIVFTSRIYPRKSILIKVEGQTQLHVLQYRMRRTIGIDEKMGQYRRMKKPSRQL